MFVTVVDRRKLTVPITYMENIHLIRLVRSFTYWEEASKLSYQFSSQTTLT